MQISREINFIITSFLKKRRRKFRLYEEAGVREYWVVDTDQKEVNQFLLQPDGKYGQGTVYDCTQKAPVHIFEGLEIDLKELFADERITLNFNSPTSPPQ